MKIADFDLDSGVYVIAEIGSNHGGDFELAKRLLEAAVACKVDAAKFQVYDPEQLIRADIPTMAHVRGQHATQLERFRSLQFNPDQYRELAELATESGVHFLASVFDPTSTDLVDQLAPAHKLASGDLTNLPLLRHVASKGKPVLLSTGMGSVEEIAFAVDQFAADQLLLLHCVSNYPTPIEKADLKAITFLREEFDRTIGYSDHTVGNTACLTAVALGATVIEKHFTMDKNQPLGDHKLSAEPEDMKLLVSEIRCVEAALGEFNRLVPEDEMKMRHPMRRGLVAKRDIPAGTTLTSDMLVPLRPQEGITPVRIDEVLGKSCTRAVKQGSPLTEADLS